MTYNDSDIPEMNPNVLDLKFWRERIFVSGGGDIKVFNHFEDAKEHYRSLKREVNNGITDSKG